MRLITLRFDSADDLLRRYRDDDGEIYLDYVSQRATLEIGAGVLVEIRCEALPNPLLVRARVSEIYRETCTRLRISPVDRSAMEFAVASARGDSDPHTSRSRDYRRLPTSLPVHCRIDGEQQLRFSSVAEDVSAGGVFIHSYERPEKGQRVRVQLGPTDDGERFLVYGNVAWSTAKGFGVRFSSRSHMDAARLRRRLRTSSESGRALLS